MRICFILLFAGLGYAADSPRPARQITSVVRTDPRTGKLVRSVIVTSKTVGQKQVASTVVAPRVVTSTPVPAEAPASEAAPPAGIDEAVEQIAARYSLRPALLHSVIKVESNYNPYAVSPKGALGLMQLMPDTARRFGVGNAFNPIENIEGGARYLRYLIDLYGEGNPLVLAAYNAGEAAVARYGGVPPYRETQNYLVLVRKELDKLVGVRRAAPEPTPAPKTSAAEPAGPAHIQEIVETDGTVRYVSR